MRASAHILIQRYLDGDLSAHELEAFRRDLAKDSELAAMLEREVQIDAAIIDDAFSIQPPPHLRATILSALPTERKAERRSGVIMAAASAVIAFLVLFPLMIEPDAVVTTGEELVREGANVPQAEMPVVTSRIASMDRAARVVDRDNKRWVRGTETAERAIVEFQNLEDVSMHPEMMISDMPLMNTTIASTLTSRHTASAQQGPLLVPFLNDIASALSGIAGPSSFALRYELGQFDNMSVFVEAGALQQRQITTAYVNNVTVSRSDIAFAPFASVGVGAELFELPVINRSIAGMAAIGVTSVGPMATADLTVNLLNAGRMSLDLGVRCIASFDLRSAQASTASLSPMIRLAVPFGTP